MSQTPHKVKKGLFYHLGRYFKEEHIELFPMRKSWGHYKPTQFLADLKAATDVALVGLPQGMAFAALAGLPIVYGIMCATLGTLVAPLFTRSQLTIAGPSNATAFMLASFFLAHPGLSPEQKYQIVPVILCLVGILCIIAAFVKVTELMQFISKSVLVGYISGAALLIIISQVRYVLGIDKLLSQYFQLTGGGRSFFSMLEGVFSHVTRLSWQPVSLSLLTLGLFYFFRKRFKALPTFALVLIIMSLVNLALSHPVTGGFFAPIDKLTGFTLSDLQLHVPSLFDANIFNLLYDVIAVVMGIAFLCLLEQTLMTKSLSTKTREKVNLNQDAFAVGMTNLALSFCPSLPSSASLTRSVLNYTSGAATRFSSFFCGIICLGITLLLAFVPITSYIPTCVLATLVIGNALNLFDAKAIRICLRSTPGDAVVLILTFLAALLVPLHTAIFIGVGISVMLFLRKAAKPALIEYTMNEEGQLKELGHEKRVQPAISIVHVEGNLFFGAAEVFREQVQCMAEDPNLKVIILRLKNAHNLDATSVWALDELIDYTRENGSHLLISGASKEVYRILRKSGALKNLQQGTQRGERNIFLYSPDNPNYSTRLALLRAQQLLGTQHADVRIFVSPKKEAPQP